MPLLTRRYDRRDSIQMYPIRDKLLSRVEVIHGQVIRFRGHDQKLHRADACLETLLNAPEQLCDVPTGPAQILWTDKEAVMHADPDRISRGELVIVDDRTHPH